MGYESAAEALRDKIKSGQKESIGKELEKFIKKYWSMPDLKGYTPIPYDIYLRLKRDAPELLNNDVKEIFSKSNRYNRRLSIYPGNPDFLRDLATSAYLCLNLNKFSSRVRRAEWSNRSRIVTFGSCFANNIHKELFKRNMRCRSVFVPESLNSPRANYTYLSQEYRFNGNGFEFKNKSLNSGKEKDQIVDINYQIQDGQWTLENATQEARFAILRKELKHADVVVLTIGTSLATKIPSDITTVESVEEQTYFISKIIEEVFNINKTCELVLTLSPVPMSGMKPEGNILESVIEMDCVQKKCEQGGNI